jgi:hypothetical protein
MIQRKQCTGGDLSVHIAKEEQPQPRSKLRGKSLAMIQFVHEVGQLYVDDPTA